jgi:tetratricopeptide (TPR) repeat protein
VINTRLATVFDYMHRETEAGEARRRALEISPAFPMARAQLARSLALQRRFPQAIAALPVDPLAGGSNESATAGFVYARAGMKDDARRELARLQSMPLKVYDAIAAVQLALGDREGAISSLERSLEERNFHADLPEHRADVRFAPRRSALREDRGQTPRALASTRRRESLPH